MSADHTLALRDAAKSLAVIADLLATYPRPSGDPNGRTLLDTLEHAKAAAQIARYHLGELDHSIVKGK